MRNPDLAFFIIWPHSQAHRQEKNVLHMTITPITPPIATVFGATGFIGRAVVRAFAKAGYTVRAISRVKERAYFLKPYGAVGQIVPMQAACDDMDAIHTAVKGANCVVYLPGLLFERGQSRFDTIHVTYPRQVAEACAHHNVPSLIHMSALSVNTSQARYAQTKLQGEQAVKAVMPHAVCVRPSIVFGPEDGFFNLFAGLSTWLPALPLIGGGKTKFQPVYVGDVATAIITIAQSHPRFAGQTFELGGPDIYSFRDLMEIMNNITGRKPRLIPLPFWVAKMDAMILQFLPKPLLTPDQVESLKTDTIVTAGAPNFATLGVHPQSMDAILPSYLLRYKQGGKFADKKRVG